jgi:membrane protein implicated in regulation of membrane protease activity
MTWSDFYLFCFIVGFLLSLFSFLAGAVHIHLPFKLHFPFHGAHHGAGGHGHGGAARGTGKGASGHVSWFNASTAMAFLAWFGGVGYLLTTYSHLVAVVSLVLAILAGLFAGWLVFKFMVKLMRASDSQLLDSDYRLEGSIGTISVPIRENGTGELTFELGGVRRSTGARAEDGKPIEKGTEVAIERFENGIAFVKRWEDFSQ